VPVAPTAARRADHDAPPRVRRRKSARNFSRRLSALIESRANPRLGDEIARVLPCAAVHEDHVDRQIDLLRRGAVPPGRARGRGGLRDRRGSRRRRTTRHLAGADVNCNFVDAETGTGGERLSGWDYARDVSPNAITLESGTAIQCIAAAAQHTKNQEMGAIDPVRDHLGNQIAVWRRRLEGSEARRDANLATLPFPPNPGIRKWRG
jgi:hypothetical protein